MPPRKHKDKVKVVQGEIIEGEQREAPEERSLMVKPTQFVAPMLNPQQMSIVYGKTPPWAIKKRPGRGGKTFSYVPHGYVTDTLNKAFGFDWDFVLLPVFGGSVYQLTTTEEGGKQVRNVAVYGELTVRIRNKKGELVTEIRKGGPGSQPWEASMEFGDALKGARSDGLKVAAAGIGVAIDLYYNEQAEMELYVDTQRKARELSDQLNAAPDNVGTFLVRCKADFGLDAAQVCTIVNVPLTELPSKFPAEAEALWDKVSKSKQ